MKPVARAVPCGMGSSATCTPVPGTPLPTRNMYHLPGATFDSCAKCTRPNVGRSRYTILHSKRTISTDPTLDNSGVTKKGALAHTFQLKQVVIVENVTSSRVTLRLHTSAWNAGEL
ncbi:hypothetical protein NDU88_006337 [Pleurodeles waltl]|uniref:Uncharacterized protein n=1 Tax=Pleurodeles waltl TaxID=8319 RepID=A0AAV7QL23_PLEWA|nr:hypothetical protein NDU88_006337 [Pleurodeles waltl]